MGTVTIPVTEVVVNGATSSRVYDSDGKHARNIPVGIGSVLRGMLCPEHKIPVVGEYDGAGNLLAYDLCEKCERDVPHLSVSGRKTRREAWELRKKRN